MKKVILLISLITAILFFASCSDDSLSGPDINSDNSMTALIDGVSWSADKLSYDKSSTLLIGSSISVESDNKRTELQLQFDAPENKLYKGTYYINVTYLESKDNIQSLVLLDRKGLCELTSVNEFYMEGTINFIVVDYIEKKHPQKFIEGKFKIYFD